MSQKLMAESWLYGTGVDSGAVEARGEPAAKSNSGLSVVPRPLPVDCWDWTKAIALPRVPVARRLMLPRGLTWGLGRDALGLSHLTYETTGIITLHQLDQPPFPCKNKLPFFGHGVKRGSFAKER
jgi:hypothetical protein